MTNKKSMVSLVMLIVVLALVVLLVYLGLAQSIIGLFKAIFSGVFPCALKKFIASYASFGLGSGGYCNPVVQTITIDKTGEKLVPIDVSLTEDEKKNVRKWYKDIEHDFEDSNWYRAYRMNQILAEGIKKCWIRNGHGTFPQGRRFSFKPKELVRGILYCDSCEIDYLDKDVVEFFKGKERTLDETLSEYLKRHPVNSRSSTSLWEFAKPKNVKTDLRNIEYQTDDHINIVYVRYNPHIVSGYVMQVLRVLPGITKEHLPEVTDDVIIIPLSEYGSLGCPT